VWLKLAKRPLLHKSWLPTWAHLSTCYDIHCVGRCLCLTQASARYFASKFYEVWPKVNKVKFTIGTDITMWIIQRAIRRPSANPPRRRRSNTYFGVILPALFWIGPSVRSKLAKWCKEVAFAVTAFARFLKLAMLLRRHSPVIHNQTRFYCFVCGDLNGSLKLTFHRKKPQRLWCYYLPIINLAHFSSERLAFRASREYFLNCFSKSYWPESQLRQRRIKLLWSYLSGYFNVDLTS